MAKGDKYTILHDDGTDPVEIQVKDYGGGVVVGFTGSGMKHMSEKGLTDMCFVNLYRENQDMIVPRSENYQRVKFRGNKPRRHFPKSEMRQYLIWGNTESDSRFMEAAFNREIGGEIIVFHFDLDENGHIFTEIQETRSMKIGGRSDDMNEQTITFDTGTTLTMDEYNDYVEQQLAWIDGLPPITPDSPWYKMWTGEEDYHRIPAKPNTPDTDDGLPKAATVNKDEFLFV